MQLARLRLLAAAGHPLNTWDFIAGEPDTALAEGKLLPRLPDESRLHSQYTINVQVTPSPETQILQDSSPLTLPWYGTISIYIYI
jgi:hypothetical protein